MSKLFFSLALCLPLAAGIPATAQETSGIAPHRITVQLVRGIRSSAELPTEELIAARRALANGGRISTVQLRALADLGDGFAALRFAQWLDQQGDAVPAIDVAHYYGMAAATGRGGSIANLIKALDVIPPDDLGPRRTEVMKDVILAYAHAGNSDAVDAVFRYHDRGTPFGSLEAELTEIVDKARGGNAAELALKLAVIKLRAPGTTAADLEKTQALLQTAMTASSLTTLVTAQNLLPVLEDAMLELENTQTEVNQ